MDNNFLLIIVTCLCVGLVAGVIVTRLYYELQQMRQDIKNIGNKRHTIPTMSGLEDEIAVLFDVLDKYRVMQRYTQERLGDALEIAQEIRKGPLSYDPDRPSGKRPPDPFTPNEYQDYMDMVEAREAAAAAAAAEKFATTKRKMQRSGI